MTKLETTLHSLMEEIAGASVEDRMRYQPYLSDLIRKMSENGDAIPAKARDLNDELLAEICEARFDNLPV